VLLRQEKGQELRRRSGWGKVHSVKGNWDRMMAFLSPDSAKDIHWTSSFLWPATESRGKGRRCLLLLLLDASSCVNMLCNQCSVTVVAVSILCSLNHSSLTSLPLTLVVLRWCTLQMILLTYIIVVIILASITTLSLTYWCQSFSSCECYFLIVTIISFNDGSSVLLLLLLQKVIYRKLRTWNR